MSRTIYLTRSPRSVPRGRARAHAALRRLDLDLNPTPEGFSFAAFELGGQSFEEVLMDVAESGVDASCMWEIQVFLEPGEGVVANANDCIEREDHFIVLHADPGVAYLLKKPHWLLSSAPVPDARYFTIAVLETTLAAEADRTLDD